MHLAVRAAIVALMGRTRHPAWPRINSPLPYAWTLMLMPCYPGSITNLLASDQKDASNIKDELSSFAK
ncbi:hypothetical protein E4T42_06759 [Aureobasidium subglaciale]|nr:hypothetical protein E4T42_06759 [Aureobasidium subglaciale]